MAMAMAMALAVGCSRTRTCVFCEWVLSRVGDLVIVSPSAEACCVMMAYPSRFVRILVSREWSLVSKVLKAMFTSGELMGVRVYEMK